MASKTGKVINLGLIGFGTIGTGVVKLLRENGELIERRAGAKLHLRKIADLDIEKSRNVFVEKDCLTTHAEEILQDPDIDIVIELIGGYEPARAFLNEAARQKKHIVTANKALLAAHGDEIFQIVAKEGVQIGFEASVGGTIPIVRTLREAMVGDRIKSIYGIVNGTANYILSKMTDEGRSFAEVLQEAQSLGFAEADPSFDIEGVDTSHKLAITLALAYGQRVQLKGLYTEGISQVSQQDVVFARELGYRIKLLAIAISRGEQVEARIHPTMIPLDDLLANVNGNFNAFHIIGEASGSVFLYGQGAGMMPTASAVISDIVDIAKEILKDPLKRSSGYFASNVHSRDLPLLPMADVFTNYYFRFTAVDRPGVLSKISGILAENNISIASVIQKGRKESGAVPVVMTTYKSCERDVQEALVRIDNLDVVLDRTIRIRIEDKKL
jgi:homoserine dehydrogenase